MKTSSEKRLEDWKNFRKNISQLNNEDQMKKTVEWWSKTPFILQPTIDWDNYSNWPTAWELIYEGTYCRSSISYLIYKTLFYLDWNDNRFKLKLIKDNYEMHYILLIDDKFVINYDINNILTIEELPKDLLILNEI